MPDYFFEAALALSADSSVKKPVSAAVAIRGLWDCFQRLRLESSDSLGHRCVHSASCAGCTPPARPKQSKNACPGDLGVFLTKTNYITRSSLHNLQSAHTGLCTQYFWTTRCRWNHPKSLSDPHPDKSSSNPVAWAGSTTGPPPPCSPNLAHGSCGGQGRPAMRPAWG